MSVVAVGRRLSSYFLYLVALLTLLVTFNANSVSAESARYANGNYPLARLKSGNTSGSLTSRNLPTITLKGGSKVSIVTHDRWLPVADNLTNLIKRSHEHYRGLLGDIPPFSISLKLLDEETFYLTTGAPRWTNAMYYKGQLIIPLPETQKIDTENLNRSVQHEFTHAVIHALSGGRCPGWFDEGIAQWAEGDENPALKPALLNWLDLNNPVPLKLLQGGFTKLETKMVPAAYAQSLFAVQDIINEHGFGKIRTYLQSLRNGTPKRQAFQETFDESEAQFEKRLGETFNGWTNGKIHSRDL